MPRREYQEWSSVCGSANGDNPAFPAGSKVCASNGVLNGIQFNGSYGGLGTTTVPFVRPYNAAGTAAIPGSTYQMLNPALGCQNLKPITLTAAQRTGAGASAPSVVCQQDLINQLDDCSEKQQDEWQPMPVSKQPFEEETLVYAHKR